ncbi:hypothetical protein AAHS21_29240 [Mycobacterium sp. 050272]|uniref:three-helix bundle dimerization domain-containing protein n=1 Tax=Mycobacterium sp. 050272 TaxID=3142488 RepID=UPI003198DFDD
MKQTSEQTLIAEVVRRLMTAFPQARPEDVSAAVHHAHARFASCPIRDFIPLFVEKRARQALTLRPIQISA